LGGVPTGTTKFQWNGDMLINSYTPSTTTSSGALVVNGGLGVGGNIVAAGLFTGLINVDRIQGRTEASGEVSFGSLFDSTGNTDGTLMILTGSAGMDNSTRLLLDCGADGFQRETQMTFFGSAVEFPIPVVALGGIAPKTKTITANYMPNNDSYGDHTIRVDCSSNDVTINLQNIPLNHVGTGFILMIKRIDTSSHVCTINSGPMNYLIDGQTSIILPPGTSSLLPEVTLQWNGTGIDILGTTNFPVFSGTQPGMVPLSTNSGIKFLRDDGTWATAGGNSGADVYISPTKPTGISGPYLWIQTGLGAGHDFSFWVEDGL
jgi:hypothetical protein